MELHEIKKLVHGTILQEKTTRQSYEFAFASDLMSDVLRFHRDDALLLTGLSTIQTVRTAEMSNIGCIIISRGKSVSDEMIELAAENHIAIISSKKSLFEIAGKLFAGGFKSVY